VTSSYRPWYPELSTESVRRRFRANLELGGGEAFCEGRLFGEPDELKAFRIGSVNFSSLPALCRPDARSRKRPVQGELPKNIHGVATIHRPEPDKTLVRDAK
jgi:hypothetical protein